MNLRLNATRAAFALLAVAALCPAAIAGTASSASEVADSDLTLLYPRPASAWIEALPVGNGRLGAMVFGGTHTERLALNEATVWTGGPYDPNQHTGRSRRRPGRGGDTRGGRSVLLRDSGRSQLSSGHGHKCHFPNPRRSP